MKLNKIIYIFIGLSVIFSTPLFASKHLNTRKINIINEYSNYQNTLKSFPGKKQKVFLNQQIDMQKIVDDYVLKYGFGGEMNGDFTGIHVTMQCPSYHNGETATFTSGLQSKQGMPVSENSLFQIGSISKSFVSVVVLQLEAEGWNIPGREEKFTIETKVGDIFSDAYPKWNNLTIKQLLNMTAGVPDYFNGGPIEKEMMDNPYYNFTTNELLNSVKKADLWFQPGQNYHYSNTNYVLIGKIIEKITNKNLIEEIENRILKPLRMNHTFYIKTFPKDNIPKTEIENLMSGYYNSTFVTEPYFSDGQDIIDYSVSWANAAASITSNLSDLRLYGQALFSKNAETRLLPQKQLEELISLVDQYDGTPLPEGVSGEHPLGYGLGLFAVSSQLLNWDDDKAALYGHIGVTEGFNATWYYLPERDIFFSFSINAGNVDEYFGSEVADPLFASIYQNCF